MKRIEEFAVYTIILLTAGAVAWTVCVAGLSLLGVL